MGMFLEPCVRSPPSATEPVRCPNFAAVRPLRPPFFPAGAQAMRDNKWSLGETGEKWSQDQQDGWRKDVESFLLEEGKRANNQELAAKKASKKTQRLVSYDLVCALDHQLVIMTGKGLSMFKKGDAEARPLHEREHLTLCCDTGSDNVCSSAYLLGQAKLRASVFWDPLHKVWRCIWNVVRSSGMSSTVLMAGVIENLERGAWNAEANFEYEKAAALELATNVPPDDAFVKRLRGHGPLVPRAVKGCPLAAEEAAESCDDSVGQLA